MGRIRVGILRQCYRTSDNIFFKHIRKQTTAHRYFILTINVDGFVFYDIFWTSEYSPPNGCFPFDPSEEDSMLYRHSPIRLGSMGSAECLSNWVPVTDIA